MADITVTRLGPTAIHELARDIITGRKILGVDEKTIESAFYMILMLVEIPDGEAKKIGGMIGDLSDTVPGRGMNGYPIFTACRFIHTNDIPYLYKELERLDKALAPARSSK